MLELKMNKKTKSTFRTLGTCLTQNQYESFRKAANTSGVTMSSLLRELTAAFCRGEIKVKFKDQL